MDHVQNTNISSLQNSTQKKFVLFVQWIWRNSSLHKLRDTSHIKNFKKQKKNPTVCDPIQLHLFIHHPWCVMYALQESDELETLYCSFIRHKTWHYIFILLHQSGFRVNRPMTRTLWIATNQENAIFRWECFWDKPMPGRYIMCYNYRKN